MREGCKVFQLSEESVFLMKEEICDYLSWWCRLLWRQRVVKSQASALAQLPSETLSYVLVDERSQPLASSGQRLHRFNLLGAGHCIVIAISVTILEFDVDVAVPHFESDYAGVST